MGGGADLGPTPEEQQYHVCRSCCGDPRHRPQNSLPWLDSADRWSFSTTFGGWCCLMVRGTILSLALLSFERKEEAAGADRRSY